jgi:hypothetical protein
MKLSALVEADEFNADLKIVGSMVIVDDSGMQSYRLV